MSGFRCICCQKCGGLFDHLKDCPLHTIESPFPSRIVLTEGWPHFVAAVGQDSSNPYENRLTAIQVSGLRRSRTAIMNLVGEAREWQILLASEDCPKYRLVLERVD